MKYLKFIDKIKMRNILTLWLFIALPVLASAQTVGKEYLREIVSSDEREEKTYVYNELGKLDSLYIYDESMKTDRYNLYSYDGEGNCVSCKFMEYDVFGYNESHFVEYEYDGNKRIRRTVMKPNGAEYYVSGFETYVYNDEGLMDSMYQYVPATNGSNDFKLLSYTTYTYDADGTLVGDETYSNSDFFSDEVVMVQDNKNVYSYDSEGNLLTVVGNFYEPTVSAYINAYKYEYTYDGNGDMRRMTYYLAANGGTSWASEHYIDYSYNSRVDISDCVLPDEIEYTWPDFTGMKHKPETEEWFYFDETSREFLSAVVYTYVFSEKRGNGINDIMPNDDMMVGFYPNPAGDVINLCGDAEFENVKVKIYNTDGKLMMNTVAKGTVDVSSLAKGIYLIDINGQKSRLVKK